MTIAVWELTTRGAEGVKCDLICVSNCRGAGRVTSLIAFQYIREQTINDSATVKNGEAVFTHSSSRSSAPGTDCGTPAAIGSAGPTELRTHGWALKEDVPVRACAQPCHSADVYVQEAVLKWLIDF